MYSLHLPFVVLVAILELMMIANGQINYGGSGANNDCCEEYCYQKDEDPYLYFGTKTSYDSINRRHGQQHIVPDCTPVQFWSLISHGTNLPDADRIRALRDLEKLQKEFRLNYEERRSYPDKGRLCVDDFNLLRSWKWNTSITEDRGNSLTSQGIEELKLLARRYKAKYSQILQAPYDERDFYFQYSNADRTHDSYQAYIEGMFGSEAYKVHANTLNEGQALKTNVECPNLMDNDQFMSQSEYDRFMNKPEYQRMVHDIFTRLGFRFVLNASIITDMYDMCRYEKAWNVQQKSPWCIAFTKEHLKMLEYAEDLKYYYKNGYGRQLSTRIGCGPVKDFYERFQRTIDGNAEGTRGTFLFSNPATLQTVLTALGVAKEFDKPTADNFYTQTRRKWRTSLLSPFSANLAAVLYQCRGEEKNRVMFFLNEEPVEFPECSVGLCNWSTVQAKYENLVRACNVDDPCNYINSATAVRLSYTMLLLSSIMLYFRI